MLKFLFYYLAFSCFCSDALYISDWKLDDGDDRIKREDEPKFKLQLKNFNDGERANQLVEMIKDKIEKFKEGREESPIVGQINPSIVDYSPLNTGILPRPPIVAPGYHRPLLPALNPLSYHRFSNPFNPYHDPSNILVAPAHRSALPLPLHTPVLHALKSRVGDLLDQTGRNGPGGYLDPDAASNFESQINQLNVNVRSDPTTPNAFLSNFFPWLDPYGNRPLPFVGAPNPETSTAQPNLFDLGEVTTHPTIEPEKQETVTKEIANPEEQKPVEIETKTPIWSETTQIPEKNILQQVPTVNEENVAPKISEDEKLKPEVEVKKPTFLEKKKFALLINKNKKLAENLLKQKIDEKTEKINEKPIAAILSTETLPVYTNGQIE